ncbi:ferritin-like domain-containing protein [Flavobacterium faecale]|uniref:YciE/YciF ferroxidase family protein n=1 Tax=Flavobacterium faecale TaxID=1355330 RepID=UPI003AAC8145
MEKAITKNGAYSSTEDSAHGLRDLFVKGLKDIYHAEKALSKTLAKMMKNATNKDLVEAIQNHLEQNKKHLIRLEEIFKSTSIRPTTEKCEAMNGILKETNELLKSTDIGTVRDAGIISSEQKIKHYEIATYGTLCAFANTLGEKNAAGLLKKTLREDKKADKALSRIAMSSINRKAFYANALTTAFL